MDIPARPRTADRFEVFGNPLLAGAALDRLTHHAHIITLKGNSYRQRREKTERNAEAKA